MSLSGRVSPWRSAVEEGRSPLGRFRKPGPCFPRTYATWDAKKDENRFGSVKFRVEVGNGVSGAGDGGSGTGASDLHQRILSLVPLVLLPTPRRTTPLALI